MDLISAIAGSAGQGMSGWGDVGRGLASLTGNGQTQQMKGYEQGVDLQTKLLKAKKERDESIARAGLEKKLADSGIPPEAAAIIGGAFNAGGGNFDQVTQGAGNLQNQGYQRQAMEAVTGGGAPNLDLVNAINMVIKGDPVDLTKVSGNTAYNPMVRPADAEMTMTPYGEGSLNERIARSASMDEDRDARRALTERKTVMAERRGTADEDAEAAYYDMRMNGQLPKGVTLADVKHAFRTRGEWTSDDAKRFGKADFSDVTAVVDTTEAAIRDNAARARQPTDPPPDPFLESGREAYAAPSTTPPPKALAKLREGVITRFGNGERWTLRGGRPVKVQ